MRALLASVVLLSCSFQQAVAEIQPEYSPYVNDNFPNQVFFGDTHLHTSYSADAGFVDTTLGPEEAYRFALGEEITSSGKKGTHLFVGRGRIQWLIENKCVPFIRIFAHFSAISGLGFKTLAEGQAVEFGITQGQKGLRAENIVAV